MIIVLKHETKEQLDEIINKIRNYGLEADISKGERRTVVGVVGNTTKIDETQFLSYDFVETVKRITKPYKLVSKEFHPYIERHVINVGGAEIGGEKPVIIAGPCAVESLDQIISIAKAVKKAGADMLRGGAFKPRTSPYSFRGLGKKGLKYLAAAREETGLPIVTEILDPRDVELGEKYADIIQIGTRNMQNYPLLDEVGSLSKPILLKRGMSATLDEFLLAAEYIAAKGNRNIILCLRGIRTFENYTRNQADIDSIAKLREETYLPIIFDPSHATGIRSLVEPISKAAIGAGADGLLIETHLKPEESVVDAKQTILPETLERIVKYTERFAKYMGKEVR